MLVSILHTRYKDDNTALRYLDFITSKVLTGLSDIAVMSWGRVFGATGVEVCAPLLKTFRCSMPEEVQCNTPVMDTLSRYYSAFVIRNATGPYFA